MKNEAKTHGVVIRKTPEDWKAVEQTNQVYQDMQRVKRWVTNACEGTSPGAIICGEAGSGKTHSIDEAIKFVVSEGIEPLRVMIRDYEHLLDIFRQSKAHRPIILEECDSLFKSKRQLNVLKMAVDDSETAPKHVMTKKGTVRWGAPVIMALNMNILDDGNFDKALVEDVKAIRSRLPPIVVSTKPMEQWEYVAYLCCVHNLIRYYKVKVRTPKGLRVERRSASARQQNTVLKFYTENLFRLADRSPRGIQKIAMAVYLAKSDKEMWSDLGPLMIRSAAEAAALAPEGWPFYLPEIALPPRPVKDHKEPRPDTEGRDLVEPAAPVVPKKKPVRRAPKITPEGVEVLQGIVADIQHKREETKMDRILGLVDQAVIPMRGSKAEDVLKRVNRDVAEKVELGTVVGALEYLASQNRVRLTREGFWRRAI